MSVKIKIKTTIVQENRKEMIELDVLGRFYQKNKASFLQYEEESEEGSTKTIVKIAGNEALILRSGAMKMRLPFAIHQRLKGTCELPFGKLDIATVAENIQYSYHAESGKGCIDIQYDFFMQGVPHASTYHLEITFQEDRK